MTETQKPLVTICIPQWQVKELVMLCLRAIRKFTTEIPYEVIVVDNGSKDDSLDYLRSLSWIKLIERGENVPENWVHAFTTALDRGIRESQGNYYIIMHTDTIVKHPNWLQRMLKPMEKDEKCAATGAWKLEMKHPAYLFLKRMTDTKKAKLWIKRKLLGDPTAKQLKRELCPRDYCAMYRAEPIKKFNLLFTEHDKWLGYTAGETMYYQLKEKDYHAEVINTAEMMKYMVHLAHATAGLRPEERRLGHRRAQKKSERRIRRFFNSKLVKELKNDDRLDK